MATFPQSTGQGLPPDGNPSLFPSFRNAGALYMATLSLPGLTIGLPIWLFSTSVVPSVLTPVQTSPSFESHHDDSKVDLSPSFPVPSSYPSTSPSESSKSSNQKGKKKKKKMKMKKSNKREANHASINLNAPPIEKPYGPPRKVKFSCKLCKGDHIL